MEKWRKRRHLQKKSMNGRLSNANYSHWNHQSQCNGMAPSNPTSNDHVVMILRKNKTLRCFKRSVTLIALQKGAVGKALLQNII